MKLRLAAVGVLMGSAFAFMGCGTVDNLCFENDQTKEVPMHIYGGIEADLKFLSEDEPGARAAKSSVDPFKVVYLTADLPLSFVADTVTLPITIPVAFADRMSHRGSPFNKAPTQNAATTPLNPNGSALPNSPAPGMQDQELGDPNKPQAPPGFTPIAP